LALQYKSKDMIMLYIDLLISLFLFILALIFFVNGRYKRNVYLVILAMLFFPLSIFSYYLNRYNIEIFKNVKVFMLITYPIIKLLVILSLIKYIKTLPRRKGPK